MSLTQPLKKLDVKEAADTTDNQPPRKHGRTITMILFSGLILLLVGSDTLPLFQIDITGSSNADHSLHITNISNISTTNTTIIQVNTTNTPAQETTTPTPTTTERSPTEQAPSLQPVISPTEQRPSPPPQI